MCRALQGIGFCAHQQAEHASEDCCMGRLRMGSHDSRQAGDVAGGMPVQPSSFLSTPAHLVSASIALSLRILHLCSLHAGAMQQAEPERPVHDYEPSLEMLLRPCSPWSASACQELSTSCSGDRRKQSAHHSGSSQGIWRGPRGERQLQKVREAKGVGCSPVSLIPACAVPAADRPV